MPFDLLSVRVGGMPDDGVHALVQRAKAGEEAAWQELHGRLQPYLLRLARDALGPAWPEKSVSDLVSESWLRAWQGIAGFRGGADDSQTGPLLRAWLAMIVKNARHNDRRFDEAACRKPPPGQVALGPTDSAQPGIEVVAADPTPSAHLWAAERREAVRAAVETLTDEKDREIIRLRFFEEQSLAQIARRLQLSYDDVRERFHRSLQRLEPYLRELQ
jgi:RNA polymerase sigma factor (sigma-70 family)